VSSGAGAGRPRLSVVVACYNMRREIARTLRSLSAGYQRELERADYEVVLVDNGSPEPPRPEEFRDLPLELRILHHRERSPSPVGALNEGLAASRGGLIGVIIDGARMASPGLLAAALHASRLHPRAIVFTQSLTLGHGQQWELVHQDYLPADEDRLLESIGWPGDGYRLFEISSWLTPDTSSDLRWVLPLAESNALFMPRALWNEVGGYEPGFQTPGGGFASVDLFTRACALPDTQLIVVTGEATFHQMHEGSAATASRDVFGQMKRFSREYYRIRKHPARSVDRPYWTFGFGRPLPPTRGRPLLASPPPDGLRRRYLDLLKQTLLNEGGLEPDAVSAEAMRRRLQDARDLGVPLSDRSIRAYTMINRRRLDDLERCANAALDDAVPGDFMECGVWRGGACILLAAVLSARNVADRAVWAADSFAGLPEPAPGTDDGLDLSAQAAPDLVAGLDEVRENFARFGLLDHRVRFLPGWFQDTLPSAPVERLALLRIDADLYSSVMEVLRSLYARVSRGGFVIIDDYEVPQCRRAVTEFRAAHGITAPISSIDSTGVSWRRE